jgi:Putative zinc-finger
MRTPHEASMAHPTATLLPWYVTGTLKESERRTVDEHLATCVECRAELESLARLRAPLQAALAEESMPVLHVKQAVLMEIQADRDSRYVPNATASHKGVGNAVERWFRNLFAPRWVPALAATLLIGQLALLLWTVETQNSPPPDLVTTRGISPASVHLTLMFKESASEARIRAVILDLKGRIIDGPTTEGVYTIAIPVAESTTLDLQMARLKQQPDLIRRIDRVPR